ncbi:MAG: hypothetical protein ACREPR_07710 [Brasilonema sp.]
MKIKTLISSIRAICFSLVVVIGVFFIPAKAASAANINELLNKPVFIENQQTKRYLFSDGAPIKGKRGDEGGWLASSGFESPKVVGADANYYNRALWTITTPLSQTTESTDRYKYLRKETFEGCLS